MLIAYEIIKKCDRTLFDAKAKFVDCFHDEDEVAVHEIVRENSCCM